MSAESGLPVAVDVDVAIVGGGPAGLTAAAAIRRLNPSARVVVLERELQAGGIPRHAGHQGFGLRDLHQFLRGPDYAERLRSAALEGGVELREGVQATGWSADGNSLVLTSTAGVESLRARATVLATGCRERPRSARLVAGSRPAGVMTTSTLQQLVYLRGASPGTRAVIVGAEHVSFSALETLAHAGAVAVAITTELPRHQSYAVFRWGAAARYRVPLMTSTAVSAIVGGDRVEGVRVRNLVSGDEHGVECDTVVFTADWVPDHELAVLGGLQLDRATLGPRVDGGLRTARPGLFAAGNLLHGAETADVAALAGRHVAGSVVRYLSGGAWPEAFVPVVCEPPLDWISPSAIEIPTGPAVPPQQRYLLRAREELFDARIEISQSARVIETVGLFRVMPGRSASLGLDWAGQVDPAAGPVALRVTRARRRSR